MITSHTVVRTAAIAAVCLVTACGAPVMRSALTPSVVRPIRTAPMERPVELGGSIAASSLETHDPPRNGDPGLHQSRIDASAHFRVRLGNGPNIGGRFHLGFLEGSSESYAGVPGPRAPLVFGGGPTISYAYRFEGSVLGIGAQVGLMVMGVPWAEYFVDGTGAVTFTESGTDVVPLFDGAVALHLYATDALVVELGGSFQNHVYNEAFGIGFVDGDGAVSADAFGFVPFVGLNYAHESGFYVNAQVMIPVGFAPLDVLPIGGTLSVGAQLGEPYAP